MKWTPRKYMPRMVEFILDNPRGALWAEMGLGKTVCAATAIDELLDRVEVNRVLVVGPLRVILHTWPEELVKWDHLNIPHRIIRGSALEREKIVESPWHGIELINYENLHWLMRTWWHTKHRRDRLPWQMIIFDESSKLKAVNTQRFKSIRRYAAQFPRVLELTGSPAPSGLLNLWAPTYLLDQGERLGKTFIAYRDRFFEQDGFMAWKYLAKTGTTEEVHSRLNDITLSLRSQDYLDLPPVVVNDVRVDLPPRCRQLYRQLESDMFLQLTRGQVEAANAGVLTGKCRQMANGAMYLDGETKRWEVLHNAKLDALADIVEEAEGTPLLVAYQFTSDLHRIRGCYPHAVTLTDASDPGRIIDQWNRGEHEMLVIHPASAGHGLNLQGGTHILVWYGIPWSFDQYEQTIARIAGGLRRTRTTFVHRIIAADTVDGIIIGALEHHRTVQDALKDALREQQETA